jgi:hypothetical protein
VRARQVEANCCIGCQRDERYDEEEAKNVNVVKENSDAKTKDSHEERGEYQFEFLLRACGS